MDIPSAKSSGSRHGFDAIPFVEKVVRGPVHLRLRRIFVGLGLHFQQGLQLILKHLYDHVLSQLGRQYRSVFSGGKLPQGILCPENRRLERGGIRPPSYLLLRDLSSEAGLMAE